MAQSDHANHSDKVGLSQAELDAIVAASDTGARGTTGSVGVFVTVVALAWSLFQLWFASPIPFMIGAGVFSTSGFALGDLGSPARVMLAWVIGGVIALLGALCLEGHDRMAAAFRKAMASSAPGFEAFNAMGRAYVHFALAHPSLFRLMMAQSAGPVSAPPPIPCPTAA